MSRHAGSGWVVAVACVLLTAFAHIEDRVTVHGDGSATVTRVAVMQDWARWRDVSGVASRDREARDATREALVCNMARQSGWRTCALEGDTITLERSFDADDVSGAERGRAYLALHRYLSVPAVRPMFQPPLLGLDAGDDNREAIATLQRMGFRHTLVVQMPGEITRLWGRDVSGVGDTLRLDLMTTPPAFDPTEEHDTSIESHAGLLHGRWTALLVLGGLALVLVIGVRRLRA